ncbi:DnaT-like ssDNA-binding domain-containing protein [Oceanimonas sp. CHS3-5]|uniref:DnaT-like ssDNA-binding domain-containing protein n=1 Tax=Oceanimonas sp. CHS3-5 TaxID=3068186 RepID=UPI00273D64FD|nr:DnaT-like ssDNA-binding domain-containing protein [Oceanimonas sp. CHS3-5]MDP5290880.1 DnaT-like ssDNA-binding domain-containing protein [Oceanimonas sp. CHS3-5]
MTPAEYQALTSPRLSHPARSLYLLYLRHQARGELTQPLDYPSLGRALAVQGEGDYRYRVTPAALTALVDELQQAGLLALEERTHPQNYHGARFRLALKNLQGLTPLPARQFAMYSEWRPDDQLDGLARLCGLLDSRYDDEELGEFIAYWLGRPEVFENQHQWMLRFVRQLKNRRALRRDPGPAPATGYQQQPAPATTETGPSKRAREMMEEARRLSDEHQESHDEEDT